MAKSMKRGFRPTSLLECLNESLECGICSNIAELRLLPCQHMICLKCLNTILSTALENGRVFACSYCRETLRLQPSEYPVCRLASEFQQQIQQLQTALLLHKAPLKPTPSIRKKHAVKVEPNAPQKVSDMNNNQVKGHNDPVVMRSKSQSKLSIRGTCYENVPAVCPVKEEWEPRFGTIKPTPKVENKNAAATQLTVGGQKAVHEESEEETDEEEDKNVAEAEEEIRTPTEAAATAGTDRRTGTKAMARASFEECQGAGVTADTDRRTGTRAMARASSEECPGAGVIAGTDRRTGTRAMARASSEECQGTGVIAGTDRRTGNRAMARASSEECQGTGVTAGTDRRTGNRAMARASSEECQGAGVTTGTDRRTGTRAMARASSEECQGAGVIAGTDRRTGNRAMARPSSEECQVAGAVAKTEAVMRASIGADIDSGTGANTRASVTESVEEEQQDESDMSDYEEIDDEVNLCDGEECTSKIIEWFCQLCEGFYCTSCRVSECKVSESSDQRKHEFNYIDMEVEWATQQFASVENPLQVANFKYLSERSSLVSQIKTISSQMVESVNVDTDIEECVKQLKLKHAELQVCDKKGGTIGSTISTFREIKDLSDVEYIKLALWIFKNGKHPVLQDYVNGSSRELELSLGRCEVMSTQFCHGVCGVNDMMIVGIPSSFLLLQHPEYTISNSNWTFAEMGPISVLHQGNKLYCLCKQKTGTKREISVLKFDESTLNIEQDGKWAVEDDSNVYSFAISPKNVFVGSKNSIDIFSLNGKSIATLSHQQLIQPTNLSVLGDNLIAVSNILEEKVSVISKTGVLQWSIHMEKPTAMCTDWQNNLWVWSDRTNWIVVISNKGKVLHTISSPILMRLGGKKGYRVFGMCIHNGFLWITSPHIGLYRLLIKVTEK